MAKGYKMLKKQPLVSVCIPAYNHEKYVGSCLRSIIAQTYKNIELIIIDDGSSDNTKHAILDLLPELESRFVHVYFKSQNNQGTCRTLNKLYSKVKGQYIYYIASDDVAKPDAIKTLVEFMELNPEYALVVGDNDIIDGNGKRVFWDSGCNNVYNIELAQYKTFGDFLKAKNKNINFLSNSFGSYSTLFGHNYIPNGYLIRRTILNKIGLFTPRAPLEDWWFMLQISKYAKMKYLDKILLSYRWHGANTALNAQKMHKMADKTSKYEWDTLKSANFAGMMSDVKQRYRREQRRRFIHKFIYHRKREGDKVVIKIFGFIRIKFSKPRVDSTNN